MKKTADFQIGDHFGMLEVLDGPYIGRTGIKPRYGKPRRTLYNRIVKCGLSAEEAIAA